MRTFKTEEQARQAIKDEYGSLSLEMGVVKPARVMPMMACALGVKSGVFVINKDIEQALSQKAVRAV